MVETGSLRVLDILADASATIAEGEVLQLTAAQSLTTGEEIYLQVIRGKTAALFAAACEVGGVIAGAPAEQVLALRDYGDALGIAFQMADDLLGLWRHRGDRQEPRRRLPRAQGDAAGDPRGGGGRGGRPGVLDPGDREGRPARRRSGPGAGA